LRKVAFMVLAIVFKGNFEVQLEKRGQKVGGIGDINRWFRYKKQHVSLYERSGGTIIKLDQIVWRGSRIHRNIHDCPRL
jgi:hypothetical protein